MACGDSLSDVFLDVINEGFVAIIYLFVYICLIIYCLHNIYVAIIEYGYEA